MKRWLRWSVWLLLLVGLSAGCKVLPHHGSEMPKPPIPLPDGWRQTNLSTQDGNYLGEFVPQKLGAGGGEKLDLNFYKDQRLVEMTGQKLFAAFSWAPTRSCRANKTVNIIKQQPANVIFAESGDRCGPYPHSEFLLRLARGKSTVTFINYRVNRNEIPPPQKSKMLDYISSANLDTSGSALPDGSLAAVVPPPEATNTPSAATVKSSGDKFKPNTP